MRSDFAAILNGFSLPFGRTSGRRLVFDGPNAEIRVYDSLDRLRLRISSGLPSSIEFMTGDVNETEPGTIAALNIATGGETYLVNRLRSPATAGGAGGEQAKVELRSRSLDDSEPPAVVIGAETGGGDFRLVLADDSSGTRTQPMGTAVLVAGTVTVTHSFVTASSRIVIWRQVAGGTLGNLSVGTITAGTSFVINSDNAADTSTVGYIVIEPD